MFTTITCLSTYFDNECPTFFVQTGIANILKDIAYLIKLS